MFIRLSPLIILSLATPALAQSLPAARLDLRIVPQIGHPLNPDPTVTDLPGNTHTPIDQRTATTYPARTRRFEVQYRLIDLDPSDDYPVVCPARLVYDIEVFGSGASGWLERAHLSRAETSHNALASPPGPVDSSGPPTVPSNMIRGQHEPFRHFARFPPLPANNHTSNGRPAVGSAGMPLPGNDALRFISALLLDPNSSGASASETNWFGLYSFDWIAFADFPADTLITFQVTASTTQVFIEGDLVPVTIPAPAPAGAFARVIVPSPPAAALIVVLGMFGRSRRR